MSTYTVTMKRRIDRKFYGIKTVLWRIEQDILFHYFWRDWHQMSPKTKAKVRKEIRNIIRRELLGKELIQAIVQDILQEESIRVESHLFKYLKSRVYDGNTRLLLGDLQSIKMENAHV